MTTIPCGPSSRRSLRRYDVFVGRFEVPSVVSALWLQRRFVPVGDTTTSSSVLSIFLVGFGHTLDILQRRAGAGGAGHYKLAAIVLQWLLCPLLP